MAEKESAEKPKESAPPVPSPEAKPVVKPTEPANVIFKGSEDPKESRVIELDRPIEPDTSTDKAT